MTTGQDFTIVVTWYEHDCAWVTKYCEENHRKTAEVPRDALRPYVKSEKG